MSNLFVSLTTAGTAMTVFERGLSVVQNNVTNVNTPGYAKQRLLLESLRFEPDIGVAGGVRSPGILDSRSAAAEEGVRRQLFRHGGSQERVRQLERLEPVFEMRDGAGLGAALNSLFQSFSALSVAPNDSAARQVALERASGLAGSFNGMAQQLTLARAQSDTDLSENLERMDVLLSELAQVNHELKQDYRAQSDAGLAARTNDLLEELSTLTQISVWRAEDGSVSIAAGGQVPLLMGTRTFSLAADTSTQPVRIRNGEGEDVTGMLGEGSIQAILTFRNQTLAGLQTDLDKLAKNVADQVNSTLAAGLDQTGAAPTTALFAYDASLGVARTLKVNPLAPQDLAMAAAGSPGGNGNALALAALGTAKTTDGYTFAQFYGSIAAKAGRALENAREDQATQQTLLAQARELRQQLQGVSLDEEAIHLMEYQRAYEATAKLVQTLDEMLETAMGIIR
jgi:flagellar hook-associated protein 1 FlgK